MREIKSLALGVFFFFCCYLIDSFCSADFNIADWGEGSRVLIGYFGGCFSLMVMGVAYSIIKK